MESCVSEKLAAHVLLPLLAVMLLCRVKRVFEDFSVSVFSFDSY